MTWSGCQSTGAEMRKYFTVPQVNLNALLTCETALRASAESRPDWIYLRLSTCCSATWASWGRRCWASVDNMKVSGFCGGAITAPL